MSFYLKITTPADKAAAAREGLRGAVSSARNAAIEEGTKVDGIHVHTDDVSQLRITGAASTAMRDPTYTVSWKTVEGTFVRLDAEQIFNIADAIREHVQACFDAEAAVLAQIDLLSDQELQGFDVAAAYAAAKG